MRKESVAVNVDVVSAAVGLRMVPSKLVGAIITLWLSK